MFDKPYSAAKLIGEYIRLRDSVTKLTERHEKQVRPYKDSMSLIENLLGEEINKLEGQAIKTPKGTAYRSITNSYKVADRDVWLNWVFETGNRDMLTAHVAKEALNEFMDVNKSLPPGLNLTQIFNIRVKRNSDD